MWEWRVFFPSIGGQKQLDIWKLLRVDNPPKNTSIRTDVYMVATTEAGLKLRGKKALEVKLRGERHESGAESWKKVMADKLDDSSGQGPDSLRQELTRKLSELQERLRKREPPNSPLLESLKGALEQASKPLTLVSIHKERASQMVGAVAVEQTDLVIEGRPSEQWRTVCLEGKLEHVCRLLKTSVGRSSDLYTHLTESGPPRGYPEFVIYLHDAQ